MTLKYQEKRKKGENRIFRVLKMKKLCTFALVTD